MENIVTALDESLVKKENNQIKLKHPPIDDVN